MVAIRRLAGPALVLALLLTPSASAWGQRAGRLSEADVIKMIELQVPDDVVISKVKAGFASTVDAAALDRLKTAGASDQVLAAVKSAGQPANTITYEGIVHLVRQATDEGEILKQLQDSPTTFTLDQAQVAELRSAGASSQLINALQKSRNPVTQGSDISDFAVILDYSGSMKEMTPDGISKMEAAKEVVTRFLRDIPNGKRLTFIVYGVTPYNTQREGCQDVKVVQQLGPVDESIKSQFVQYISRIQPYGATPLAQSLRVAGLQLARRQGMCQLVLITDGMETCGGDPARVAEELKKDLNLPHGVDVVGFGVAPQEKIALQYIVAKGKGHYYNARNAKELNEAIVQAAQEAQERARAEAERIALAARQEKARHEAEAERLRQAEAEAERRRQEEEARRRLLEEQEEENRRRQAAAQDLARKNELPYSEKITWDTSSLENDRDNYILVNRKIDEDKSVSWVVTVASDDASRLSELGYSNTYRFRAYFLDEDDVEIVRVDLQQHPNFAFKGQNLRFTLEIPKDEKVIRNTKKIKILRLGGK
jgi:flagellar biosynthesis GTPase FlhF